jgi:metallo-beta-lactamase class B
MLYRLVSLARSCARISWLALVAGIGAPPSLPAQTDSSSSAGYSSSDCPSCAAWNAPHAPLRIYGNSYYVGTDGLGSILITSSAGHILIDGGLPESAPRILANIRSLGFRIEDVKLILNSHAHYDHAGGIAALQRASGAVVAASPSSAPVIERGTPGPDDPQYRIALPYPPARDVHVVADGETLRVGPLAIVAHFTPGHTPGGTTWSWRSCEDGRCLNLVYADSQTPVSADGFRFTGSRASSDFERSRAVLEQLSCDVLITPHPGASNFWKRIARRDGDAKDSLIDSSACKRYAAAASKQLAKRLAAEAEGRK